MAESRYSSPIALARSIRDRVRTVVALESESRSFSSVDERHRFMSMRPAQLRCDIAVQRFVARLEALSPGRWVVKGGVALHMRLDPSRPSLDLDLADTSDPISRELQIRDLEAVALVDLADYFRFEIERGSIDTDEHGSMTVSVMSFIGTEPFEDFDIDMAPPDATTDSELSPLALPIELDISHTTVEVNILRLEPQLAEKICAMFERHGQEQVHSSRWRDLADVAMIAMQTSKIAAEPLLKQLERERARRPRLIDGLPSAFELPDEQIREWQRNWGGRGRTVPVTIEEALETATRFIAPLLDGTAAGEWDPEHASWIS